MAYRMRTMAEKRALVRARRESGLTRTRYALENGIPASAFSRWIERVDEAVPTRTASFLPVRVVDPARDPVGPPLVVELAGVGHRIEVPVGFDAVQLRAIVAALCGRRGTCGCGWPRSRFRCSSRSTASRRRSSDASPRTRPGATSSPFVAYKRLERGRFSWPVARAGRVEVTATQLAAVLDGIDLSRCRKIPAWNPK
jgi:hypothetical protein